MLLNLATWGIERKGKRAKFWISQKWFEISTPNFHQLLTSLGTRFVPKIKVLGASKFGFPAKNLQNFRWAWQTQFLSHTLIILENWISFEVKQMLLPSFFDTSNGLNFPKNLKSCTVQIYSSPWLCLCLGIENQYRPGNQAFLFLWV